MDDEPGVIQLVIEVLDSRKSPEEVCRLWPNRLEEVRRRVARCRLMESRLGDLFPSSEDGDGRQQANFTAELPQIPLYEVQLLIGHGGMGVVYRAQHLKLKRLVALKMIRSGAYASPTERSRFFLEAEAVAALRHANIVQVYDLGEVEGRPYFTMEFLGGGSLAQQLAGGPFSSAQAARYLATLAMAVQAAHSAGIVHRDLKPANVLLSVDGQVKISDFGLARRMSADEGLTFGGARIGTPSYMAPEQAAGRLTSIGPSADIYALGAILYEMLTGRPPFLGDSAAATERQVVNDDPAPPRRLNTAVPRDLETICLKCLRKDPARRYETSADLAADADRYLRGEPILARPVGPVERAVKWTRRHRGLAASLAGIALSLVLLAVVSLVAMAHFRTMGLEQQTLAREKGKLADEKEIERGKAVAAEREAERKGEEIRRNLYLSQMNLAGQAAISPSGIGPVRELLMPWEKGVPDLRNWEWYYFNGLCNRDMLTFRSHLDGVVCVAWSPDGQKLASVDAAGIFVIWDKSDGREFAHRRGDPHSVNSVAWSPDGKRIATAGQDHTVRTWNAATGAPILTIQASKTIVHAVAWSPDGARLAAGDHAGDVQVWNADSGANIHILHGHNGAVFGLAWSPDGAILASASEDRSIRLWDPIAGIQRKILSGHRNWVRAVAWNRDGSRLASASNDQTAKIWDPSEGKELLTLSGHTQAVTSVAWSPDGTRLVTGSDDQTLRIWQPDSPTALYSLRGHFYPITSVAWSPDGALLASASYDHSAKIWDASAGPEILKLEGQQNFVPALAWQKDSRHLATVGFDRTITVWDVRQRGKRLVIPGNAPRMRCAAWSPDGRWLASADMDRTIHVCDATTGKELKTLHGHTAKIRALAWSPDSQRLASAGEDQSIRIWDAPSGTQMRIFEGKEGSVSAMTWSPDGKRIASGSVDGTVKLWNAADGVVTLRLKGNTSEIKAVAWSPDGQRLAAANVDQTITVSSTASGELLLTLHGHAARVIDVAWSPSGTRLASASDDNTIKLWDPLTGEQTLTLEGGRHMYAVAWSPDGMLLASCGNDSTVLVHDATAGYAAALTEPYLAVLDRRIAANPNDSADWRTKAQVHAGMRDWNSAEADLRRYLALKPDEHWCALGYWAVGPYPEDVNAHFAPEINPDPGKQVPAGGTGEPASTFLYWQRVPVNSTGFLDFRGLFGYAEHISAYALLKIYCPQQQNVKILLGANQVRLWLNGHQIHENLTQRAAFPDSDVIAATLTPGWNTLLARVVNVTGTHAMYLRLSDAPADLAKTGGEPTK